MGDVILVDRIALGSQRRLILLIREYANGRQKPAKMLTFHVINNADQHWIKLN